ncbi:MAG: hypothetical protein VX265_04350 [Myxococcota bacterium]|nr:hypothetical protein [Myxococcota bacterium]
MGVVTPISSGFSVPRDWFGNAALADITGALEHGHEGTPGPARLMPPTWGRWGAMTGALLLSIAVFCRRPRTALCLLRWPALRRWLPSRKPAAAEVMGTAVERALAVPCLRTAHPGAWRLNPVAVAS